MPSRRTSQIDDVVVGHEFSEHSSEILECRSPTHPPLHPPPPHPLPLLLLSQVSQGSCGWGSGAAGA